MLEMRPVCECCERKLLPDSDSALICSFECTFCADCTANVLNGTCPNCGGDLVRRPTRLGAMLDKFPASTKHVHNPACGKQATT
ncbi:MULTISPECIES: DUF1272 domain-containing protein [Paraburkholderia]|uniref:DUF1272 domain-containing protein n=1 Tax=Paraburkholderia TaxID=1822464 RepID=UPI000B400D5E|nr:DUF1272 domain-containing protein [Paraburkholderia caledonica]